MTNPNEHDDHELDLEPIPGLPRALPPGERLLWQGKPDWKNLARHTFRLRWLGVYFAIFTVTRGVEALRERGPGAALVAMLMVVPLAGLCLGVLALLAWLNARATVYSITSRRVVMRFGIAIPMTFNFPFKRIAAANVKTRKDGDGDIALQLSGPDRIAWLHLWPHARPWHLKKAQPMMRSLARVAPVAAILAEAVQAWSTTEAGVPVTVEKVAVAAQPSSIPSLAPTLAAEGR